jgi:hypothetical protein
LSNAPIGENFAGNLAAPSKLKSVPVDFADDNGAPLICSSRTKSTYTSKNYSFEDVSELMRLGVESLSAEGFLADLSTLALENPHGFRQMPNAWHGRLSKALSRIICDNEKVKATVSELEIVPLYDGHWVSPN